MKIRISIFVLMLMTISAFGQVKFGFRVGTSTEDVGVNDIFARNEGNDATLGVKLENADFGVHVGFFAQFRGRSFFVQPEVIYNSNKVNYRLTDIASIGIIGDLVSETYQSLDIPINVGMRLGPLRFQAGPVAHLFLGSENELTNIDGYDPIYDRFSLGYQAGVGLDIWKLILDVKYEGNLSKWGQNFRFFGEEFSFDRSPGRIVASLGIAF